MEPHLELPSIKYKDSFLEAIAEQDSTQFSRVEGYTSESYDGDFDAYLQKLEDYRQGKNLPGDWVPQTVYWLIDNEEFIGRVSIRHYLNDNLEKIGGHIGYSIRPSKRGKGYGNLILTLGLTKAKELGLENALVTCDRDNLASKKIIEKNGGVFEDERGDDDGQIKLRFWVPTS
ncbi:MAG: GNAT family N-acetyltransferase [Candidatus Pacebacteria bacterium]|nr:GNAT family N-acetyltransferase [Candidatus Paceibacterota bacterium]